MHIKDSVFCWGEKTYLCGVVNMTPDSFSGDGLYKQQDQALKKIEEMVRAGAEIIDVGGESTRPGARPVSSKEEKRRIIAVIRKASQMFSVPISVDTYKAEVAEAAFEAGACILNDVTALRADPKMERFVSRHKPPTVVMHMKGKPRTMQRMPIYKDVVSEVAAFLRERKEHCMKLGLGEERILIDPGIGFGKTLAHNLELLRNLEKLCEIGPLFLGPSRKSFLGQLTQQPVEKRVYATCAVASHAVAKGVSVLRVHDVEAIRDVLRVVEPLARESGHIYYLGLGSNKGNRRKNLSEAIRKLGENGIHLVDASSIYETVPEEMNSKRLFYNQVIKVWSFHPPQKLLRVCQETEKALGRREKGKLRDREIDIDIIAWDGEPISQPDLQIPHPKASQRSFVLVPLAELDSAVLKKYGWKRKMRGIQSRVWERNHANHKL